MVDDRERDDELEALRHHNRQVQRADDLDEGAEVDEGEDAAAHQERTGHEAAHEAVRARHHPRQLGLVDAQMGREWAAELLLALQILVAELLDGRLLREGSTFLRSAENATMKYLKIQGYVNYDTYILDQILGLFFALNFGFFGSEISIL